MENTTDNYSWREKASCKGIDPNVFVPNENNGLTGRTTYATARDFCKRCIVVEECLMFALKENMEFGMFGGTTPRERRTLKKQIRLSAG
jgi:WhiB family redox-sensing transcriptional regulator